MSCELHKKMYILLLLSGVFWKYIRSSLLVVLLISSITLLIFCLGFLSIIENGYTELNSVPPKFIPIQNLWVWSYWKEHLCKYNHVKMRSYWLMWVVNPVFDSVLLRKQIFKQRHRHRGEIHVKMKAKLGWYTKAKECQGLLETTRS